MARISPMWTGMVLYHNQVFPPISTRSTSDSVVESVEQLSFSAARSREVGQEVLYITERAVFRLSDEGLELIELAPGIDLEKQVLSQMAFRPIIRELRPMPLHMPGAWRNS